MLILSLTILLQVLLLVGASADERIYFVKPSNFSSNCPNNEYPCLTLGEYTSNQSEFFTSSSTFLFLPGNHTTTVVIFLVNVAKIRFEAFNANPGITKIDFSVECLNVSDLIIQGLTLGFSGEKTNIVLSFINSSNITILRVIFQGSVQHRVKTRGLLLEHSTAKFENCTFRENKGVEFGGALLVIDESKAFISNSTFIENSAKLIGGAVFLSWSESFITDSAFISNHAKEAGGIYSNHSTLFIARVKFIRNSASMGGAAVFQNTRSEFFTPTVVGNIGAALFFYRSKINFTGISILKENINTAAAAAGGAVTAQISVLSFSGTTIFKDNYAYMEGGALAGFVMSKISFVGNTKFINNRADEEGGGAILLTVHTKLELHGSVLFLNNNCTTCYGGAISVTSASEIEIFDFVTFKNNSAQMGGAIYLRFSTITLNQGATMETIENHADWFGGGIFHMDNIDYYQCDFTTHANNIQGVILFFLPDCFLRFRNFSFINAHRYQN